MPVYVYGLWLALKSRSLFFFTSVNPNMEAGGLFGSSKFKQLNYLPEDLKPKTLLFSQNSDFELIKKNIPLNDIPFPLIAKPDKAERGKGIQLIKNMEELKLYAYQVKYDWLIQEYIQYPFEAGVLYYRYPGEAKGCIPSIVIKEFLSVTGDGSSSVEQLMSKEKRTSIYIEIQKQKSGNHLKQIPEKGKKVLIEPIGNHNRGTTFRNGKHLISEKLESVFSKISQHLPEFYYGRIDIKSSSLKAFCDGRDLKIMEVNGANAEPAHIYDPDITLFTGIKTLHKHWHIVY